MPLLTTALSPTQPDPIALAMVAVVLLMVVIALLRKRFGFKPGHGHISSPAPAAPQPLAPGSAGQLKLHSVDPKTAAIIMAIVADNLGKPLNELHFISIKEVSET